MLERSAYLISEERRVDTNSSSSNGQKENGFYNEVIAMEILYP